MAFRVRERQDGGLMITGYDGSVRDLRIPEQIDGKTVCAIAQNAFSGREDLQTVSLPPVDTLGRYAFYNCKNLKKLTVYDSVEDYYDGVIRQCRALTSVMLVQTRGDYSVMKELLADCDRKLTITVEPQGLVLVFPAYVYDFIEDVEARVLHHKIEGSGYPYRECVTRKGVDLLAYDRLFRHAVDDDRRTAFDMAAARLMHPIGLEEPYALRYEQYLEQEMPQMLTAYVAEQKTEEIAFFCKHGWIAREALSAALELAAKEQASEITALLLSYKKERFGGQEQGLSLEDW